MTNPTVIGAITLKKLLKKEGRVWLIKPYIKAMLQSAINAIINALIIVFLYTYMFFQTKIKVIFLIYNNNILE